MDSKSIFRRIEYVRDHPDCVYVFVLVTGDIEGYAPYDPLKKRAFEKTMDNLITDDWIEATMMIFGEEDGDS